MSCDPGAPIYGLLISASSVVSGKRIETPRQHEGLENARLKEGISTKLQHSKVREETLFNDS